MQCASSSQPINTKVLVMTTCYAIYVLLFMYAYARYFVNKWRTFCQKQKKVYAALGKSTQHDLGAPRRANDVICICRYAYNITRTSARGGVYCFCMTLSARSHLASTTAIG